MVVSLKKWLTVVALGLALAGSMLGWSLHANAATGAKHVHMAPNHAVAMVHHIVCPPYPFECI